MPQKILRVLTFDRLSYVPNGASIDVVDHATKKVTANFHVGYGVMCMTTTMDKRSLLVGCVHGIIIKMNIVTGEKENVYATFDSSVICIEAAPDDNILVSMHNTNIERWGADSCNLRIETGFMHFIADILFSAKRSRIYYTAADGHIEACDYKSGACVTSTPRHENDVTCIAWAHGEETLVSGDFSGNLILWDAEDLSIMKVVFLHDYAILAIAISRDGSYAIFGDYNSRIMIIDIDTSHVMHQFDMDCYRVHWLSISPDGAFIGIASDRTIHLTKMTPPLYNVIHEDAAFTDRGSMHRLYSTGVIRESSGANVVARITSASECVMISDTVFELTTGHRATTERMGASNRAKFAGDVKTIQFKTPTAAGAQQWIEAICAVIYNLGLDPSEQTLLPEKIIPRYRYDAMQSIIEFTGPFGMRFPKSGRERIGNYLMLTK